jgi:protein involved in polysaccharide export with SLBB domain
VWAWSYNEAHPRDGITRSIGINQHMDLYLRSHGVSGAASTAGAYARSMMRGDVILLSFVFSLSVSLPVTGQTAPPPARNAQASRSELESQLATAQREEQTGSDKDRDQARMLVTTLNERLTNGDFQVGDRVLIYVQGQQTLSDTFTVREGQIIQLNTLTDVDLHGVLRSELQGHVYTAVSKFLRDPVVRTGSLVRVAVLGGVAHPGFYALPADMLLSDAVMHAGGLGNSAEIQHTIVTRAGVPVIGSKQITEAIKDGSTLDQLSLRAGDQIEVGATKPSTFLTVVLPIIGGLAAIVGVVVLVTRH